MDRSSSTPSSIDTGARRGLSTLAIVSIVLLIIGGLNWALVGLFGFDLVAAVFGSFSTLSRIVYVLVGASAVAALFLLPRITRLA